MIVIRMYTILDRNKRYHGQGSQTWFVIDDNNSTSIRLVGVFCFRSKGASSSCHQKYVLRGQVACITQVLAGISRLCEHENLPKINNIYYSNIVISIVIME